MASDEIAFRLDWGRGPFRVSPEREALRRRIVDAPRDDTLRLAYANLAIAEGDPRGEYVRLALLAGGADRSTIRVIEQALEDLRARYGRSIYAEWCSSAYGHALGSMLSAERRRQNSAPFVKERCGFVNHVTGDRRMDMDLDRLADLAPLESWAFVGGRRSPPRGPGVDDLSRIDQIMPDVVSLTLDKVDAPGLEAIARLPKLEHLHLAYRIPKRLAEIVRRRDTFPRLRTLSFFECAADPVAIAELAQRAELESLSMELTEGLPAFVAALSGAPLGKLSLNGYIDGDVSLDFTPMKDLRLPRLHSLQLMEYQSGPDLLSLAHCPALESLETLSLSVGINDELMVGLLDAGFFSGLRDLSLLWNRFSDEGLSAFAERADAVTLERLILRGGVQQKAARALLETMTSLSELDLGGCPGFQPLSWYLELDGLCSLRRFRGTSFGGHANEALGALAASPHAASLREIHLPELGNVTDEAIDAFIASEHLSMLGSVHLRGETEPKVAERLYRRFGHRLAVSGEPAAGPLPEPDLDPWWSTAT